MSQSPNPGAKARPILFSGPMVRALLDGRKSQTRRVVRDVDGDEHPYVGSFDEADGLPVIVFSDAPGDQVLSRVEAKCPYGKPGDLLWVREAFSYETRDVDRNGLMPPWFWADGNPGSGDYTRPKPSIHMPRWASRLTLELTAVRAERLQDIPAADAIAEGLLPCKNWRGDTLGWQATSERGWYAEPVNAYDDLWESINGPGSWDANPWVWVLSFAVHHRNVADLLRERSA